MTAAAADQPGGTAIVTLTASKKLADGTLVLDAASSSTAGAAGTSSASDRPALLSVVLGQGGTRVTLIHAPITIRQAGAA